MNPKVQELLKKHKKIAIAATAYVPHPPIRIGPLSLNRAIGSVYGPPSGNMIQFYGEPSHGKTTLWLDTAGQFIRDTGEPVLFINLERSFDLRYATEVMGPGAIDSLVMFRVESAEEAFDTVETVSRDGAKLVVLDSVSVMVPKSEHDKSNEDSPKMAGIGGPLTRFCNRVRPILDNNGTTLILINQMRSNFSTMSQEKKIPYGALALQHHCAVNLHIQRIAREKEKIRVRAVVRKNKVGAPERIAEFDIVYGKGVDHNTDTFALAVELGIIRKAGSYFYYDDDRYKAQGEANAIEAFPLSEIYERVLASLLATEKEEKKHDE